jgi:hypothetical protein
MADQQPWRRRMLPPLVRPRTPLAQTSSFDDLLALHYHSDRNEPSLLVPEPLNPSKRHSRPKFLARASQYFGSTAVPGKHASQPDKFHEPEPPKDLEHAHINQIVDTVFTRIATNLGKPLDAQNNELILRILEAYRDINDDKENLRKKLDDAANHCKTTLNILEGERKRWRQDELAYKAEIKRLELIIAHGKTGLSAVALARQESLVRHGRSGRVPQDIKKVAYAPMGKRRSEPFGTKSSKLRNFNSSNSN